MATDLAADRRRLSPARRTANGAWAARAGLAAAALPPLAVLAIFFAVPVGGMLRRGFVRHGALDVGAAARVLTSGRTLDVLWFTVWSSAAATVLCLVLGLPLAFVVSRLRFPGRALLRAAVLVPFVLPTVVVGAAFDQLLAPGGLLAVLHLEGSAAAIVAAMVFFNVGVVVRVVGAVLDGLDPRPEQAAAALGASPWTVVRTVTLPALRPAMTGAACVVFLFCATAFGVVLTMGGLRYANIETQIYLLTTQQLDLSGAAALSVLQLVVLVGLLLLTQRLGTTRAARQPVGTLLRRPRAGDVASLTAAGLVVVFLALPILGLISSSLLVNGHLGLGNFRALGSVGSNGALVVPVVDAVRTSLLYAGYAAVLALTLAALVSVVVTRPIVSRAGRVLARAVDGVFMLPLGVSAVTLGFGFLITLDRPPLDLRTSWVLIPIAQALVALPLAVRTIVPALAAVDDRQRQAAATLGASRLQAFATIDLAAAWRPLLASAGFAFGVSLGEFGATSFLARSDNPTLPVVIYTLLNRPGAQNFGMAMAASVVLAGVTTAVVLGVERLRAGSYGVF